MGDGQPGTLLASEPTANADRAARERLRGWLAEHGPAVRGFLAVSLRQLGLPRDMADDLLQEVFARAWQARTRYQEDGRARGYLLQIADRLVIDAARRGRSVVAKAAWLGGFDLPAPQAEPAAALDREESSQRLHAALATLSEPQRRTLLLRYFGDLPFAEIATTLGLPLNTVLSHCRRGLLALKILMD